MSTILDALKKSEQERKLNNIPTLSDMPTPQEPSRWPLIIVIVVIVALLVGLSFWLYRGSFVSTSAPATTQVLPITNDSVTPVEKVDNEIVVNVVSFSEEVDQRFAMINGKLYREGEFVRAGLRVEEILTDSVILNQRGRRITRKP